MTSFQLNGKKNKKPVVKTKRSQVAATPAVAKKSAALRKTLLARNVTVKRKQSEKTTHHITHQAPVKKAGKKKTILSTLLGVVLLGGAGFGITEVTYYDRHVDTEDAHIDAEISPVISRIGGYVDTVRFVDNQRVSKGDTLVILDGRDLHIKLEHAEAALGASSNSVAADEATIMKDESAVAAANSDVAIAKSELASARTEAERESARTRLASMNARLRSVQKKADSDREKLKSAFSSIQLKKADIDYARLQLSYTVITAPVSGIVSKRVIQPGEFVQAGQSLFSIVNDTSFYVTANFKETQIERMRQGQRVELHVDAYPDTQYEGSVGSFSPATGSAWSLLPPENASGNFVKVVQRVPVKIHITGSTAEKRMLKPGMNVKAIVSLDR